MLSPHEEGDLDRLLGRGQSHCGQVRFELSLSAVFVSHLVPHQSEAWHPAKHPGRKAAEVIEQDRDSRRY